MPAAGNVFCYNKKMESKELVLRPSEKILVLAGIFILAGVAIIEAGGGFTFWFAAKILYLAGVILFLFNK